MKEVKCIKCERIHTLDDDESMPDCPLCGSKMEIMTDLTFVGTDDLLREVAKRSDTMVAYTVVRLKAGKNVCKFFSKGETREVIKDADHLESS